MKIRTQKGFSFIEVTIVVALIGIMVAVGLVSLSSSRNQKQVDTEARKVISIIRQAQNNALAGKTVGEGNYPCSFGVIFNPGGDRSGYRADYGYKTDINSRCDESSLSQNLTDFSLEYGVSFSSPSSDDASISFSVPFGKIGAEQLVILSKEGTGDSFNFCVCASGKIVEEGDCTSC